MSFASTDPASNAARLRISCFAQGVIVSSEGGFRRQNPPRELAKNHRRRLLRMAPCELVSQEAEVSIPNASCHQSEKVAATAHQRGRTSTRPHRGGP